MAKGEKNRHYEAKKRKRERPSLYKENYFQEKENGLCAWQSGTTVYAEPLSEKASNQGGEQH